LTVIFEIFKNNLYIKKRKVTAFV